MSLLTSQPLNPNFLSSNGYRFHIENIPNVNFFVQAINIPGKKIDIALQSTPYLNIPLAGNKIRYNDLTVTFKVDEDLQNFMEIYEWLDALAHTENFDLTKQFIDDNGSLYSDALITLMDNNKNANIRIRVKRVFPISISDIIFSSTNSDEAHIVATATFKYQNIEMEKLFKNVD